MYQRMIYGMYVDNDSVDEAVVLPPWNLDKSHNYHPLFVPLGKGQKPLLFVFAWVPLRRVDPRSYVEYWVIEVAVR